MDYTEADKLVKQLSTGFETLQDEYQKLFGRHEALERKLSTARDQYNELAKLYGTGESTTPPMSLSSSPGRRKDEDGALAPVSDILSSQKDQASQDAAKHIRLAMCASQRLKPGLPEPSTSTVEGVKIWSGPSADAVPTVKSTMPSISESPMEQDFTIEGMPSNLGCPFASMNGKKLSSHAASVLSRYNPVGSAGGAPSSTPLSSVSRVNGRESFNSRRESQRVNIPDPIKAEICGLSNHADADEEEPTEAPVIAKSAVGTHVQANADSNVCPIRFLDQHSPEEVATYFENHKHDLPRSHEICVKRYQSNEHQIRELDARYGNLVSMIQGLGVKHQPMLPAEPPEDEEDLEDDDGGLDPKDAEKVRNWANSVSQQAQSEVVQVVDGNLADDEAADSDAGEERQSRFARPLRPIRVGESPSRPWGINVPVTYLEKVEGNVSEASSQPARIPSSNMQPPPAEKPAQHDNNESKPEGKGRCPFGFDQAQKASGNDAAVPKPAGGGEDETKNVPEEVGEKVAQGITFIAPGTAGAADQKAEAKPLPAVAHEPNRMVFNGPVFIGYSAEDAAKILRESGLGRG